MVGLGAGWALRMVQERPKNEYLDLGKPRWARICWSSWVAVLVAGSSGESSLVSLSV